MPRLCQLVPAIAVLSGLPVNHCVGANTFGQLGDSTTQEHVAPASVSEGTRGEERAGNSTQQRYRRREMIMAGQILAPFNSHVRVEDIISVIEKAAKTGMRVVFLVRYPVDPWEWFRDHWITTESSRDAILAGRKIMERYSREGQRALAEEMVAPWRHVLQKMGVKATVDVYTGSWANAVEKYGRGDEVCLVMQAQNDLPKMRFLRRPNAFFGTFKRTSYDPVVELKGKKGEAMKV
jgi:hypothetical protein